MNRNILFNCSMMHCLFFNAILVVVCSCSKNEYFHEIISVDVDNKNHSTLNVEIESIIPLETNNRSLFGEIRKLRYSETGFYILDTYVSKTLLLFSKSGKFINKVSTGKGPGECIKPYDFVFDKHQKQIQLYDQNENRVITFDNSLSYIKGKSYTDLFVRNFEITENNNYLTFANYKYGDGCYSYVLYDNEFNIEKKLILTKQDYLRYTLDSPISNYDRVLFCNPIDYNIYSLNNELVTTEYIVDFHSYKLSASDVEKGVDYIRQCMLNGTKVYSIDNLIETSTYILFSYLLSREYQYCLYSKESKKAYNIRTLVEQEKLPKGKIVGNLNNKLIYAVESKDFLLWNSQDNNAIEIKSNLNGTDNSIILIIDFSE